VFVLASGRDGEWPESGQEQQQVEQKQGMCFCVRYPGCAWGFFSIRDGRVCINGYGLLETEPRLPPLLPFAVLPVYL
jgi:hypothetical protein